MSLDLCEPGNPVKDGKSKTITRAELAAAVYDALPLNRRDAMKFVAETLDEIAACLAQGEDVMLTGFGRFEVRMKSERLGRNPKTGDPATIAARKSIVFKPSKIMRRQVAKGLSETV